MGKRSGTSQTYRFSWLRLDNEFLLLQILQLNIYISKASFKQSGIGPHLESELHFDPTTYLSSGF